MKHAVLDYCSSVSYMWYWSQVSKSIDHLLCEGNDTSVELLNLQWITGYSYTMYVSFFILYGCIFHWEHQFERKDVQLMHPLMWLTVRIVPFWTISHGHYFQTQKNFQANIHHRRKKKLVRDFPLLWVKMKKLCNLNPSFGAYLCTAGGNLCFREVPLKLEAFLKVSQNSDI